MAQQLLTNDILEVKFYHKLNAQGAINTRHYLVGLTPIGSTHTDQDVADRFNTVFRPLFRTLMSAEATYVGCTVQIKTRNGFDPAEKTDIGVGTLITGALPPQIAGLISLRTGRAGRQNRGRMYVAFPAVESCGPGGAPTNAYGLDLNVLGAALVAPQTVTVGGLNLSIIPVLWNPDVPPEVILSNFSEHYMFATMRTRSYFSAANIHPIG